MATAASGHPDNMASAPGFEQQLSDVFWHHAADPQNLERALAECGFSNASYSPDNTVFLRAEFDDLHKFYALRLLLLSWKKGKAEMAIRPLYVWADQTHVVSYAPDETLAIERVRDKLSSNPEWVASSARLVYYLLDEIMASLFPFLDGLNDRIAALEEAVYHARRPGRMEQRIFHLKREALKSRRALASMRDAVSQLVRHWSAQNQADPFYYMELYDHMIRHFDTVDTYRELVNSVLDLHLSTVSNRLNEIVKTLTLVTTALLPASLMASLYGMNFDYVPFSHYRWGFFVVLGLIAAVSLAVYGVFRRRDWV